MSTVVCPECGKPLDLPDRLIGKRVKCPCGHRFVAEEPPIEAELEGQPSPVHDTCAVAALVCVLAAPVLSPSPLGLLAAIAAIVLAIMGLWGSRQTLCYIVFGLAPFALLQWWLAFQQALLVRQLRDKFG